MTETTERHIFLDTMLYLHFRPVEDTDWPTVVDADAVVIIVPRITVQELDKHKNSHPSRKIRDRAKSFLVKLEEWAKEEDGSMIRENVRLKYMPSWPKVNLTEQGLSSESADDLLVAATIDYRDNVTSGVVLVSDDSTPRLTARHLGIGTLAPTDELRLPEELTAAEKENKELKRQLQKLAGALPVLSAQFGYGQDGAKRAEFMLTPPLVFPEKGITDAIEGLREEYPHYTAPESPKKKSLSATGDFAGRAAQLKAKHSSTRVGGSGAITGEEYARANRDVDTYLSSYRTYMTKKWEWANERLRTIALVIEIVNTGTAPAEDVDVFFHFPDGLRVWAGDIESQEPGEPSQPTPPRTPIAKVLGNMSRMVGAGALRKPALKSSFSIRRTNSFEVRDKFARIKHGDAVFMKTLYVEFDSFEEAKSFGIEYALRPANLPEPVEGRLDVVISTGAEDTVGDSGAV